MFRKDLIPLLLGHPMSVHDIAVLVDESPRQMKDDLKHLIKSLKHMDYRLNVTPARCRKCGFTFHADKLDKPGHCPDCKGDWIEPPLIEIVKKN